MSKKYTIEEITDIVVSNGFELISLEYVSANYPIIIKDQNGYYGKSLIGNLRTTLNFKRFHLSNPYTIQNIKLWVLQNNKPFELLSDTYYGQYDDLIWKCKNIYCQEQFDSSWVEIHVGNGCPYCAGRLVCLSNCLFTKIPDISAEWNYLRNGDMTPRDVTCKSGKYVWWKCKECHHEWYARIADRSNGKGCPSCHETKGEKRVRKWLSENNFKFDSQYVFHDLVSDLNHPLRFDFIVFNLDGIKMLIEYDGIFHYEKVYDGDEIGRASCRERL